ncbi:MAG: DUF2125 domain-containing protein [Alphaproteobacteria bacterium]|jgi:hypothetical protein|nr:DUF2125 domain-containing protein [Alphaproteobacteria bacterium]
MESEPMLAGAIISAILAAWHGLWQHIADEAALVHSGRSVSTASAWVSLEHDETLLAEPRLTLNGLRASGRIESQAWQWQAGQAIVTLSDAAPQHLEVLFTAPQRFSASGSMGRATAVLWADNLGARLELRKDGRVANVTMTGDGLTLIGPQFEIAISEAKITSEDVSNGMLRLTLSLAAVSLPVDWRLGAPLDGNIDKAEIVGWIEGVGPPLPIDAAGWHKAEGALDISSLDLTWGPLSAQGNGRATLDKALKLQGHGRFTLNRIDAVLEAAAAAELISANWQQAISTALDRLAAVRGEENSQRVTGRFSMANGVLRWAGLPLAVLPALGCSETAAC